MSINPAGVREMTLNEWVQQLPVGHSALAELETLRARITDAELALEETMKKSDPPEVVIHQNVFNAIRDALRSQTDASLTFVLTPDKIEIDNPIVFYKVSGT